MSIIKSIKNWLWSGPRGSFKFLCQLIYRLVESVTREGIRTQSQALAYTTILSIVPFMAVSFSILKSFGVYENFIPALEKALNVIGIQDDALAHTLVGFVDNMQVGLLGSIGFVVLFYTVVSLVSTIESAFNGIWNVRINRNFAQRVSYYLIVVLIGPVLIFSIMSLFSSVIIFKAFQIPIPAVITEYLSIGFTVTILSLVIAGIYYSLTNAKVKLIPALIGGAVAALAWYLMGKVFSDFIASSNKYSGIYSGFASVILFFIWMDLTWLIMLLGNRLTYLIQNPDQLLITTADIEEGIPQEITVKITPKDRYGDEWIVSSIKAQKRSGFEK